MSGDTALQRARAYLEDARDPSIDPTARCEALDAARSALLDARRARVQPELLLPIFKDICAAAASDSAHLVRCVVPRTVEDLCLREMKIFVPVSTPFLVRSLHDDHVLVAKRAVRALTTLFRKLVGFVVSVGVSEETFPEARLSAWLQMQTKAISLIHAQDDGLRKAATKFAETVVLAFSYSGGPGSPDHFTLDYVLKTGSKCPLLNATTLEEEGVRCVKAVAQLIHSGLDGTLTTMRPDGSSILGLPPLSFMTAISVLSNLVRRRRKLLQFTLPPLLVVVAAIAGSTRPPSPAFRSLSEGQKQSIISVLRFSILALRAYPHTRTGRAGSDINLATNDLSNYEKELENRRKEEASAKAAQAKQQNAEVVAAAAAVGTPRNTLSLKRDQPPPAKPQRPLRPDPSQPWPRPPPKDAYVLAQNLTRSMPHKEVVNFIMTRLLLNIPPPATVPGAVRPRNLQSPSAATDEPSQKRPRRSRFGTKDDKSSNQSSSAPKKVVAIRKVAPPVVPVKLSPEAAEKLVTLCCRRVMKRESEATVSGAGPLRTQLLARLLTSLARTETAVAREFCGEACAFIAEGISARVELALAWLHSLLFSEEFANFNLSLETSETKLLVSPSKEDMTTVQADLASAKVEKKMNPVEKEINEADNKPKSPENPSQQQQIETEEDVTEPSLHNNGPGNVKIKDEPSTDEHVIEQASADELPRDKPSTDGPLKDESSKVETPKNENPTVQFLKKEPLAGDRMEVDTSSPKDKQIVAITSNGLAQSHEDVGEDMDDEEYEPLVAGAAYERIFINLLLLLKEQADVSTEAFSQMITEAPVLPPSVLETLSGLCKDASRTKLGLQTLRDIVIERSGKDRRKCMSLLLEYTSDEDEVLRGPAIRLVANKIFVECGEEVSQLIEDHAVAVLNKAIATLPEPPTPESIDLLERCSLLLTALCGQKHELLVGMATAYAKTPAEGRKILLRRAKDLAGHLGMAAKPILDLIGGNLLRAQRVDSDAEFTSDGVEELALEILRALLKKFGKPTNDIVEAACRRYDKNKDTNFVIAVLPGLRREALIRYLAAVVETSVRSANLGSDPGQLGVLNGEKDEVKSTAGFREAVGLVMNARPPALSPAELLVELHKIKPTAAVSTAIRGCFEMKIVYKQADVAQAIQQLIEMTATPDLFMRTVHLARIFHPELEKYLTESVMEPLIGKKVWTNKLLWDGYLRYCAEIKEKSLKLLLRLPAPQLEDALEKQPILTAVFKDLVSNPKNAKKMKIQAKHKKVISAAIKKSSKSKT